MSDRTNNSQPLAPGQDDVVVSPAVRAELLAPGVWQEPLEGFARATKLAVLMVDPNGKAIGSCINPHRLWQTVTGSGRTETSCPFCVHPESPCAALAEARESATIAFSRDRSGLAHMVVPVRLGGQSLAFLLAGQVFDQFPEQLLLYDLARATGTSPQALWDIARHDVPVSRNLLQAYGDLLATLAESYVRANYGAIVDRQRYAEILGLHADLAERKEIEAALRQADRRKDQFLATLAHELRNPLAPMMTAVHLLKNAETHGRSERALATLDRQLHHMVRLIDDLLDFSRITRGQISLRRERIAVADVIGAAVETSRPEIEQHQHSLVIELPDTPQWVDVDGVRISQAVSNLLNNAARYMHPGGDIRLTVAEEGDQIVVSVVDSGYGIAPDLISDVFEMFVRGRDSAAAAPGGLGIGLTLAKTLVEMHGGSIAVKSEGPNRGSEFTIRLPRASPPNSIASDPSETGHDSSIRLLRILIVEDNPDARDMMTDALTEKGHEVRTAVDGPTAFKAVEEWCPDVALLDIGLPGMSGHEVARRLRDNPRLRNTALVALTGWGQEKDRRLSADAGIGHHLTKPIDPDQLERVLAKVVNR